MSSTETEKRFTPKYTPISEIPPSNRDKKYIYRWAKIFAEIPDGKALEFDGSTVSYHCIKYALDKLKAKGLAVTSLTVISRDRKKRIFVLKEESI